MSTEAPSVRLASAHDPAEATVDVAQDHSSDQTKPIETKSTTKGASPAFLHSPPDSNNAARSDPSDSELSDLDEEPDAPTFSKNDEAKTTDAPKEENTQPQPEAEEEDDIGEVLPDHWSGAVAVFKPTMHQFKDFKRFMAKVNSYGMKSGIIKIIPPQEWKDKQPPLDDMVKHVRVREPIKQDIMGSNGTYRQVNILHGRSYNVPQWRKLCNQSEHQPPARRGERRANAEKPKPRRAPAPKSAESSTPKKGGKANTKKGRGRQSKNDEERPMTPVSPRPDGASQKEDVADSVEQELGEEVDPDEAPAAPGRMGAARPAKSSKTQSVSARRKFSKREGSAMIDEAAFKDFDYKMDISDFTPERCEELERAYWKTLTYAAPLYGADMMGTLFDDRTDSWNLNKLPNLLDVLGTKIPGVNTAYLYFGMWKATFAWHLEDVDLYSINYVHFGAPKQWYSISQADARRFEGAMKNIWPADAKACSQFLRHKGFLISPQHLQSHYGIKVNRVVSYPGEFVVTFPYGYHSGYNLGYNCAEAVNFALEPWLEMGKIAKRCECAQAQDSVWINVWEIERKLRGEETEYEETDEEEEEDEDDEEGASGLPSPPGTGVKIKVASRKRKRGPGDKDAKPKVKKIKLRLKTKAEPPCCLCPNDISSMELLPTDDGRKAHRVCALYIPETYIDMVDGKETVSNMSGIHKDRTDLKCLFCRSKRGACFQCSQKKCARAYHATCAAAAGVFVEEEQVPVYGEDETEYKEQAFEFSCRFHRTKRDKKMDGDALEEDSRIRESAKALKTGEICQMQYFKGDIFAGAIVENRQDEQTLLVDVLPHGHRLEVEWKWLLLPDAADYHLPKASANAIPMPASRKAKEKLNAKRYEDDKPRKDDPFVEGCVWAEFNLHEVERNQHQIKIDFSKDNQVWHYLGKGSTDAKAQYTEDPANPRFNPKGNFLDTIPKPPKAPKPSAAKKQSYQPPGSHTYSNPATNMPNGQFGRMDKPYTYTPRPTAPPNTPQSGMFTAQRFVPTGPASPGPQQQPQQQHSTANFNYYQPPTHASSLSYQSTTMYSTQRFENKSPQTQTSYSSPHQANQPAHTQWQHSQPPQPQQQAQVSNPHTSQTDTSASSPAPTQFRQHSKPSWQVHSSIYQKYAFFQVHHNRESSKYRTPYSPWGGFTNGYEGDMRSHLMANPQELMRRSSMSAGSPPNVPQQSTGPSPAQHSAPPKPRKMSSASPATPQTAAPPAKASQTPQSSSANKPHQAPKAEEGAGQEQSAGKPKVAATPKPYKIPSKQTHVPLPANFLARVGSSPVATPTPPKAPAAPVTARPAPAASPQVYHQPAPSTPQPQEVPQTSQSPSAASPNSASKISTTPVPIPRFPAMTPHQAAAKAVAFQRRTSSGAGYQPPQTIPQGTPASATFSAGDVAMADAPAAATFQTHRQEFPDVPGSGSMDFMETMMANLRRVVHEGPVNQ